MDIPYDKIIAELKKSAPIWFVAFVCLFVFGLVINSDFPHGINKAIPAWITYTLLVGCPIFAIGTLVIWVGQHSKAMWDKREMRRYSDKRDATEREKVLDHVHHLNKAQLIILLGFLRSRNGRGEQLTYSKTLDNMTNYGVLVDETNIYSTLGYGRDGGKTLVVHPAIMKDRKRQDGIIVGLIKSEHDLIITDNEQLKGLIEDYEERDGDRYHSGKKVVRLPTLFK